MSGAVSLAVVGAHPDDAEHLAAGASALHVRRFGPGSVTWIVVTSGELWHVDDAVVDPATIARLREDEARAAAGVVGVDVMFLRRRDSMLADDSELSAALTAALRTARPDIVVTHNEQEAHPDHVAVARTVADLCVARGQPQKVSNPRWLPAMGEPHTVSAVFAAGRDASARVLPGAVFVDIGDVFDVKFDALRSHRSQGGDGPVLARTVEASARAAGLSAGCEHAEAFIRLGEHPTVVTTLDEVAAGARRVGTPDPKEVV